jgi:hypothetical protein
LISGSAVAGIAGATIRTVANLPEMLDGGINVGPYCSARPGTLLRVVPRVGRFLVRDGSRIDACLEPGADAAAVEAVIQSGLLGALIHQRGELALHATTLVSRDRGTSVALAGPSGAGKSTVAYKLIRRGWMLLSDDLTRVTLAEGAAVAWPGRTNLRLKVDACVAFGLDPTALQPAHGGRDKYVVALPGWREPVPLSAIVCLDRSAGAPQAGTLSGLAALALLSAQTYRRHYIAALGQLETHVRLVTATLGFARLVQLRGASGVSDMANMVEDICGLRVGSTSVV